MSIFKRIKMFTLTALLIYILYYFGTNIAFYRISTDKVNIYLWYNNLINKIDIYGKMEFQKTYNLIETTISVTKQSTIYNDDHKKKEVFKNYWRLQHNMRTNYKKIMAPCKHYMKWKSYYPERTAYTITSANHSYVTLDIQPAGQYSRLTIETYSMMKTKKTNGGDSWRIHVYGTTSVPVTTIDNKDGSYEACFLIIEPGFYYVDIFLDYTLCDGFKDPPANWFRKGNSQGKHQSPDTLPGYEKPNLEEKFNEDLSFEVKSENNSVYEELKHDFGDIYPQKSCDLWDGFGYWSEDLEWIPYVTAPFKNKTGVKRKNRQGVFWIYGDSVGDFLYRSILRKPLCNNIFNKCNRTYNWVYNIISNDLARAKTENDNEDFSVKRIISELKNILVKPEFDHNSMILLNYGLHYAQEIPFKTFEQMMDSVIQVLKGTYFQGKLIWKTTTAMQKWKWGDPRSNARHSKENRFLTSPRVELYNAFSTSKMCDAGFDVLDVYPMSYSYPNGTGSKVKPWDAVHYAPIVFKSMEQFLYKYFDTSG